MTLEYSAVPDSAGRGVAGVARWAGIAGLVGVFVSACAGDQVKTPAGGAGGAAAGSGGVTVPPGGSGGEQERKRRHVGRSAARPVAAARASPGVRSWAAPAAGGGATGVGGASGGIGGAGGAGGMDAAAICARWTADRANLSEGTWSGATATCTAGDMAADARANALRLVNLYRWLAALPPVTTDPAHDAEDRRARS